MSEYKEGPALSQCPECERFCTPPLMPAWAATYQHEDGCAYDPDAEDDGYRFDPVTGESRLYREA